MKSSRDTVKSVDYWICPKCGDSNSIYRLSCGNSQCYHPRPPQFNRISPIPVTLGTPAGFGDGGVGKSPGNSRKPHTPESELQKACEKWLRFHGIEYLHLSPFAREKVGWPDLVFAINGKPFAIELKSAKGKLRDKQLELLSGLAKNGWTAAVCRTQEEFLKTIGGGG